MNPNQLETKRYRILTRKLKNDQTIKTIQTTASYLPNNRTPSLSRYDAVITFKHQWNTNEVTKYLKKQSIPHYNVCGTKHNPQENTTLAFIVLTNPKHPQYR